MHMQSHVTTTATAAMPGTTGHAVTGANSKY